MPAIDVASAFLLTLDDRTTREFQPGLHEVSAEVARHWYVQLFLRQPAELPPPVPPMEVIELEPAKRGPGRPRKEVSGDAGA